jgi:hypothetical protein
VLPEDLGPGEWDQGGENTGIIPVRSDKLWDISLVPLTCPFGFVAMALSFLVGGFIMQGKRRSK